MENNMVLDIIHVGDIKGEFYVPSYQRGYRWGEEEVTRLLDDIYNNQAPDYYLQPVVVRKAGNRCDLIDGQQRLTTLYLIYKYMRDVNPFYSDPLFSLTYDTRPETADFLKNLDLSRQDENIDFWFISNAYKTIQKWFEKDLQIRVTNIFKYLKENVYIIWYEVFECEDKDANLLFERLNIGKIPLTSAELVKAMFLSNTNSEYIGEKRQDEIALQWDSIERELHDESLWSFLTNDAKSKYPTRIDLILDLMSGKQESNREKYYTFFKFDEMRKEMKIEEIWDNIQQTFLVLKDWYEDHELYHKIGYLIASGEKTLYNIFKGSENQTKDEFRASLDGFIKKSIEIDENYADLSYEKTSEKEKINRLLLLFNVESVRKNGEETQWFPFDKFKYSKSGKVSWSLEHIHAQHSEGMKTQETWKEWLKRHLPSVKTVAPTNVELAKEIQCAIDKEGLSSGEFEEIQRKVWEILSVTGNVEYMHSIANLALLSTADNAALNNSTFDVKRNEIIKLDRTGQYIPFCTKMVFLKYYTPSENNQLHFWGQADRIAYVNEMNRILKEYLGADKLIILEKE